ncbi:putative metabolite transport protein YyaJ [Musca vetustissima]|uniref:putative metabolite transport protein YyaJ n=1 Tax=Musca vetustissima TaxID=27455 RepID=UPI002AB75BF0|nr:putative metabolite transport protein YyaJ [Musca vetustissima]
MDSIPNTPVTEDAPKIYPLKKSNDYGHDFETPADYETAIQVCGFGRFNIILLLAAIPAIMGSVFETAVVSFIVPSAECDLNLDLVDKGILNGITYGGMIVSAVGWGYLADSKGRKNLLIWGFLIDVICVICAAISQNVVQLMLAKFFGGFVICGPFAVLISYLSEFHGSNRRPQVMMIVGIMFMISNIILPILAMSILPKDWSFQIFNMKFVSWKIFIAICGIPSLLGSLLLCLLPESPRFLMSNGRNSEAMEAFKMMYAYNKGKPRETFPIKTLVEEVKQKSQSKAPTTCSISTIEVAPSLESNVDSKSSKEPNKFRLLCSKRNLWLCIVVCLMQFFVLLGLNTMRLWLPQLFASLNEYEHISSEATSMCTILEYSVNKTEIVKHVVEECRVVITPATYTNNIIVASVGLVTYLIAGSLVNAIGNKQMQIIGLSCAGVCGIGLYWSSSSVATLIISSLYVALCSMANTSAVGASANLFPTSLRTIIVSMAMMLGRIGSILGNVLFPIFMSLGCIPPFVMVGAVLFIGCILAAILPNTSKLELK